MDITGLLKKVFLSGEDNYGRKTAAVITAAAAIFFLARFIKILVFPHFLTNDEMFGIYEGALRYAGMKDFFAPEYDGAFGTLLPQFSSFFAPLIREHLEYYRVISVAVNGLIIYGIYLLAGELYSKKIAALAALAYSASFWGFFTARAYVPNMLAVLLGIFSVYFLIKALAKSPVFLLPGLLLYCLGFMTYLSFLLVIPAALYIIFDFYITRRATRLMFFSCFTLYLFLGLASLGYEYSNSEMAGRLMGVGAQTFSGSNIAGQMLRALWNIRYLFIRNYTYPEMQFPLAPLLNPCEAILFVTGISLAIKDIKTTGNRITLAMLLTFLIPLFTADTQQARVVLAQAPLFILAAAGMAALMKLKRPYAVIFGVLYLALAAASITQYFLYFEKFADYRYLEKKAVLYLNEKYGPDAEYLQGLDLDDPERTLPRLRAFYDKNPGKKYKAFTINAFWHDEFMKDAIKEDITEAKLFLPEIEGKSRGYPYYITVLKAGTVTGKAFAEYDKKIRDFRGRETGPSDGGAAYIDRFFSAAKKDAFYNTLLKVMKADMLISAANYKEAAAVYLDKTIPSYMTPDMYLRAAKCLELAGDLKGAEKHMAVFTAYIKDHAELK